MIYLNEFIWCLEVDAFAVHFPIAIPDGVQPVTPANFLWLLKGLGGGFRTLVFFIIFLCIWRITHGKDYRLNSSFRKAAWNK